MTGDRAKDWFAVRAATADVEWAEAAYVTHAYSPHRHDTYAVGVTTHGVQEFSYRGEIWRSLPGDAFVLHPDEMHDGRAGTDGGYGYQIAYVSPGAVSDALQGQALPFVSVPVSSVPPLRHAIGGLFCENADKRSSLWWTDKITSLADTLFAHARSSMGSKRAIPQETIERLRDCLVERCTEGIAIQELEREFGMDRYALTRWFKQAYGVGPHRFLIMRRLDRAKKLLQDGQSLADAAAHAGFADQAHMTRQFRATFGLTPGKWRELVRASCE